MQNTTTDIDRDEVQTTEISDDEWFRLLADERRRAVIEVLTSPSGRTTLTELAIEIDMRENDCARADATAREDLLIDLHHNQLPLLAEAGVVEYDPESRRIERRQQASDLPTA